MKNAKKNKKKKVKNGLGKKKWGVHKKKRNGSNR